MQTARKIADIYARRDAMHEAVIRFRAGNDAGIGYDWTREGGLRERILAAATDTEVDVYLYPDGSEVAVGNAGGPWAVEITPASVTEADEDAIESLSIDAGSAGDSECVELCRQALSGSVRARIRVAEIIEDAEAQADGGAR